MQLKSFPWITIIFKYDSELLAYNALDHLAVGAAPWMVDKK